MGGNSHALDINGEIIAYSEKIDLTFFSREKLISDFLVAFESLNKLFFDEFQRPLWEDFSAVRQGSVFSGSSKHFFDLSISDSEFLNTKKLVGDIDIMVPRKNIHDLLELLNRHQNRHLGKRIHILGHNIKNELGHKDQINAVFEYQNSLTSTNVQIDFEAADFENGFPTPWSQFSHSASWDDMKFGFKGVSHKYLLMNIVRATSKLDNAIILTNKSPNTLDKAKPKKDNFKPDFYPRMWAFSVSKGLRRKYKEVYDPNGNLLKITGTYYSIPVSEKIAYQEIPVSESVYYTDPKEIFSIVFDQEKINPKDYSKFHSFIGLVDLMKKYLTPKEIFDTIEFLVKTNLFGAESQKLDRDDWEVDFRIKMNMVDYLYDTFPLLDSFLDDKIIKEKVNEYYANY